MAVLLLVAAAVVMSGNLTAAGADAPAVADRERRSERWAADEQPCAVESSKRALSQRWKADVLNATLPGGGNNTLRKKHKFNYAMPPSSRHFATRVVGK